MFIRETSPDGKMSFWTIRPEANRCLTLDHVYKVSAADSLLLHRSYLGTFVVLGLNVLLQECLLNAYCFTLCLYNDFAWILVFQFFFSWLTP